MRIFDCHSHWGTERQIHLCTPEQRAQQEKVWKTEPMFLSDEEMVEYFKKNNAKVILDLSFTKFLPIGQIREEHDHAFALQRKHPDSIFGHWLQFDPRRSLEAIREFDRASTANGGFVGLCVNGQVTGIPASDRLWDPLIQLSIESNRPMMILPGSPELVRACLEERVSFSIMATRGTLTRSLPATRSYAFWLLARPTRGRTKCLRS